MNKRFDAYIFDMDGTLWDAVDSYAETDMKLFKAGVEYFK